MLNKKLIMIAATAASLQFLSVDAAVFAPSNKELLDKITQQKASIDRLKNDPSTPAGVINASQQELTDQCGKLGKRLKKFSAAERERAAALCGKIDEQSSATPEMVAAMKNLRTAGLAHDKNPSADAKVALNKACKAVATQRRTLKSLGRNQIDLLTPEERDMICQWCDESTGKDTYKDAVDYDDATSEDDARQPYCAVIRKVRQDKDSADKLKKGGNLLARALGGK